MNLKFLETAAEEMDRVLTTLAEIPGWTGGERERAEYCFNYLKNLGYEDVKIDEADNVILAIDPKPGKQNTAFMAHLDTVFSQEDRFQVTAKAGKLYCPGIGDNTANAAGLLLLAKYLKENPSAQKSGLYFVWSSGEEGLGNLKGCRTFTEAYQEKVCAFVGLDLYYNKIFTSCVGSIRYRVDVCTEGGHSYLDFGKTNAICELAEILHEISVGEAFHKEGLTYNAGHIEGGQSVNSIAARASMLFEFRSGESEKMRQADKAFRAILDSRNRSDCEIRTEVLGLRPCGEAVDPDLHTRLTRSAQKAIRDSGCPKPILTSASTDCNIPLSLGIASICFGVCSGGGTHTKGEWIVKGSNRKGMEILLRFFHEYFE